MRPLLALALVASTAGAQTIPLRVTPYPEPPEANGASATTYPNGIVYNTTLQCIEQTQGSGWTCLAKQSAVATAQASANAASAAAGNAQTTANAAQTSATAAGTAVAGAQSSADAAATAASNAQTTANGAATAAATAQTTANGAQSSATSAGTAAANAQTTANGAQTAATNAATAASAAQTTANSASSAASAAQTTANGAQSAVTALTPRVTTLEGQVSTLQSQQPTFYFGSAVASGLSIPLLGVQTAPVVVTVAGAQVGAFCEVGINDFALVGATGLCVVTAANTVTVRWVSNSGALSALLSIPNGTYPLRVGRLP